MAQHQPIRKSQTPDAAIPDKLYFRIGEVARLCEVPAYVLRFWETEFSHLKPNKGGTGQRLYRRRDVEMALRIKTLLYDEGYTIPGARQVFKAETEARHREPTLPLLIDSPEAGKPGVDHKHLLRLKRELGDLHAMLSRPPAGAGRAPLHTIRPGPPRG